jgi:hypothetical protein
MAHFFRSSIAALFVLICSFSLAQSTQPPEQAKAAQAPETPRQALIDMITGGGKAIQKHLTVEIQQAIAEASKKKDTPSRTSFDIGMVGMGLTGMPALANGKELQTFNSGPVLLSFSDPHDKEKIEVRLEGDDLRGNEDDLQLSIHISKDGQELTVPFIPSITVGMKQQDNIWRINEVSANFKLAIGDPKFFEDIGKFEQANESEPQPKTSHNANQKAEPAKMPVSLTVTMLSYAEASYAQGNPEIGFTCNIADLINAKDGAFTDRLDPQIAGGTYNGYRFSITGCDAKPAIAFHIVAEPMVAGSGSKAYCTDPTRNLRIADDGKGNTCLASGRLDKQETSTRLEVVH